jgi:GTP-binding protein
MRFIDQAILTVKSGDGGNGCKALRRERFKPRGGPSGGDGGRGGDVIFEAERNLGTLLDLRRRPRLEAKRGGDGRGSDCHGRGAGPLFIRVPVGTALFDDETGELLGDLVADGQQVVVAEGGRGGLGNRHFATPSNRAPQKAEPGFPGEARVVRLELKLLADVGLLGLPNVGKSTLISRLSSARPKIADYPFTTLVPNLGVVALGPGSSFVMADIPGIIRGAADGAGLGSRFLRHVQRTAILIHMVAPAEDGEGDLLRDFDDLTEEITRFDPDLATRARIPVLNKADLPAASEAEPALRQAFSERGDDLVVISAVTGAGLDQLKKRIEIHLREAREDREAREAREAREE